jgi:hypothetical protein
MSSIKNDRPVPGGRSGGVALVEVVSVSVGADPVVSVRAGGLRTITVGATDSVVAAMDIDHRWRARRRRSGLGDATDGDNAGYTEA